MNVLVIGGGGREHALAWKLAKSPQVERVHCAPGNPGIAQIATCHNVASTDLMGLLQLALREKIGLTVVGPEGPLAAGIVDIFTREGLPIFGPTARAAELEASKAFAKTFMQQYGIPTAHYGVFTNAAEARAFAKREPLPLVIKADGLASGKGVVIARDWATVDHTIEAMLSGSAHGEAGRRIVIEQFLEGNELSCIAIVDGERYLLLEGARDHKALCDDDAGPNTGGMGVYTPTSLWTPALEEKIRTRIFAPTIAGLRASGRHFVGFLYAGLMIVDGEPYALEYNVRLGDPEAQALLFRLRSDLAPVLRHAAQGHLTTPHLLWDERASVCVVMAADGYPATPTSGDVITGLDDVAHMSDVMVFHAGTQRTGEQWITAGGRVLGVTALGTDLANARERAYAAVERIQWPGAHYRRDIGRREIKAVIARDEVTKQSL